MDGYEIAYNQIINSEVFKNNETYGECIVHLLFKYDWEKVFYLLMNCHRLCFIIYKIISLILCKMSIVFICRFVIL